jgi:hypothetical protein
MIGYGIGINPDTSCSTRLDHISEFISGTISSIKFVGSWLIHEIPWIELSLLWPRVREHGFLRWENFYTHISSFTKEFALLLDIGVWPAEELNDGSLLSIFVVVRLIDWVSLPNQVLGFLSNGEFFTITVSCFDNEGKSIREARINGIGGIRLESFVVEVVFQFNNAIMLSALCRNVSRFSVSAVNNVVKAHNSTKSLVLRFVKVGIWSVLKESLETSLRPFIWISCLLATCASNISVEVRAVIYHTLGNIGAISTVSGEGCFNNGSGSCDLCDFGLHL